ncbi:hypothetical protein HMPREF0658_1786 [Hoylesella marshii DSM 16973 = JCM 13450]|uniref:Uncharacterized protein n=1 Tax=Hoylesella marshii DSM 16973 = JCM 13450 TaxID=862515 RepID=E0NUD3_9BACT|nr:hypothetical protein HMPREF0658_1786 [Hoylesella marshii DSM 16973 = JCM 13450]
MFQGGRGRRESKTQLSATLQRAGYMSMNDVSKRRADKREGCRGEGLS